MDFDATSYRMRIDGAADFIRRSATQTPEIAIVLGSGLGPLADAVRDPVVLPYGSIPGFPEVTVVGHSGRLVLGTLSGRNVVVMQGRFHYYEGHDIHDVVFPIRVLQRLGIRALLLTNAAGGIDLSMKPGELMVLTDHLGLFCESPLRGANLDDFGPRFCDMSRAYDPELRDLARRCAAELGIVLHSGVYAFFRGPQFETPAEIRALAGLGASAVGMSTVPEAIVAAHGGTPVLGISCITNHAAGLSPHPLNHEEVLEVGRTSAAALVRLLTAIVGGIGRT